jgi:hypothetical protein
MILYLHGFRSSPRSFKARVVQARLRELGREDELICPHLPPSPQAAMELVERLIARFPPEELSIIGSSLGGYYATWLAEGLGCRAALLNPAVRPPKDLEPYVGVHTEYHSGRPFEFKREYLAELEALRIDPITLPERYYLLAATGDEVLDYREMLAHYPGAQVHLIEGSDHAISEFPQYVDEVLAFCTPRQAQ